ncbi:hypothetical protein FG379_003114 [Cryptosporidium bovis]|uniref:uncharacterized protein n=1 Tax=Cryptosporidium bovis TaxID=310047 RepID=UPI003519F4A4|nr:hypothetical protein FG379_003114 [Cryptosporidium bovis]
MTDNNNNNGHMTGYEAIDADIVENNKAHCKNSVTEDIKKGINNSNTEESCNCDEYDSLKNNESDIEGFEFVKEDNSEEKDSYTDYSEDGDNEEETRKVLPERSSRGKRYSQLIGEEEEKDAKFWGHDTWEEDENDSGWSSEDEKIELEILGGVDSDYTDSSDNEDKSDDGKEEEEEEIARAEAEDYEYNSIDKKWSNKKNKYLSKGKYEDPSLFLKSAQKDILKKVRDKLKNKKKRKNSDNIEKRLQKTIEPRTISVRASTLKKKRNLEEIIKKREEARSINTLKRKQLLDENYIENDVNNDKNNGKINKNYYKKQKINNYTGHLSQEDRLKACKEIEKINIESLSQLEAIEEHKRYLDNTSSSIRKQFQSGPLSVYISWSSYLLMDFEKHKADEILKSDEYCREIIIYTDGNIPIRSNQNELTQDKENNRLCCIYGTPAKYLDPLTNKYFCNVQAFRAIRKDYYANSYKDFINEMNEVERLIKYNKNEINSSENLS